MIPPMIRLEPDTSKELQVQFTAQKFWWTASAFNTSTLYVKPGGQKLTASAFDTLTLYVKPGGQKFIIPLETITKWMFAKKC